MKMTYTKSQYEMPDGKYLARFKGVTMREATGQLDQKGQPMPPGMTWDFEIVEQGEHCGKKADRLTGRQPTPKSGCGKLLAAVTDSILKDGQEIDLDQFVGAIYRVTVVENRVSDNPAPVRVYDHPLANGANFVPPVGSPASPGTNGTAASRSGPPPRQGPPPKTAAPTEPKYWIDLNLGGEPELDTMASLQAMMASELGTKIDLNNVKVCPDGGSEWTPILQAHPAAKTWTPW